MAVWRIRLQTLNIIPMARWMVGLGRHGRDPDNQLRRTEIFTSDDYRRQVYENSRKTYVQEIAVDSLRHSDCKRRHRTRTQACTDAPSRASGTVTLVLMKIDEHSIAAAASPAHEPFLAPHTAAFLQTMIIGLGSVARFFLNDLRVSAVQREQNSRRYLSIGLGVASYLGATAIWVATTWNLLHQVGWPAEKKTYGDREDGEVLWALALVQSGYPLMSLVQILWLNYGATNLQPGENYGSKPMPPGQMDPALSVVKDIVYGVLDSVTKGGLALFCALRATRDVV